SQKLAELKRSLEVAEAVKALNAARKSFAGTAVARIAEAKKLAARKAKRELNLSPERRAQLAAAMKARWAAKKAAETNCGESKPAGPDSPGGTMNYWEIIADDLSKAGWSYGCVSALDCNGRTIWIADAHRGGKRFIVGAEEKVTAFLRLEAAIRVT